MKSPAIRIGVAVFLAVAAIAAITLLPIKDYLLQFVEAVRDLGAWGPVVLAAV